MIFLFGKKVVSGNQHDIDILIHSPTKKVVYEHERQTFDTIEFNTTVSRNFSVVQCVCENK